MMLVLSPSRRPLQSGLCAWHDLSFGHFIPALPSSERAYKQGNETSKGIHGCGNGQVVLVAFI